MSHGGFKLAETYSSQTLLSLLLLGFLLSLQSPSCFAAKLLFQFVVVKPVSSPLAVYQHFILTSPLLFYVRFSVASSEGALTLYNPDH